MTNIIYDKKWCRIYYYKEYNCVLIDWIGYATSKQFREACNVSLQYIIEKKVDKIIADNSKAAVVKNEDQDWMNEVWFPKALEAGFLFSAVVVAKNIFREISIKNIVNKINDINFTVNFFENQKEALDWIKKTDK